MLPMFILFWFVVGREHAVPPLLHTQKRHNLAYWQCGKYVVFFPCSSESEEHVTYQSCIAFTLLALLFAILAKLNVI